ncbi:hypothetical protein J6590_013207 [Homalodisca vitripennis]|nr:hypothetical protein J6590_013207 [Homalodisca vitripennis]
MVLSVKYHEPGNLSARECYNNVIFASGFPKIRFFVDRVPSVQHSFLVLDVSNSTKMNTHSFRLLKVFGSAKVIILQQSQMFKLSSPYFPPRTLQILSSSLQSEGKQITDLQGRIVRIATFNCSLFSILQGRSNSGNHDGIEMRTMLELAQRLNFTLRLVRLQGGGKWGERLSDGSWKGGISEALLSGEADIGFCNFWNVLHNYQIADFGPQWAVVRL